MIIAITIHIPQLYTSDDFCTSCSYTTRLLQYNIISEGILPSRQFDPVGQCGFLAVGITLFWPGFWVSCRYSFRSSDTNHQFCTFYGRKTILKTFFLYASCLLSTGVDCVGSSSTMNDPEHVNCDVRLVTSDAQTI